MAELSRGERAKQCSAPFWLRAVSIAALFLTIPACADHKIPQAEGTSQVSLVTVSALIDEGAAAYRAKDFEKAREKYQAALDLARELNDDMAIGGSLARLGSTYWALQENDKALELNLAAIPYFEKQNDLASVAVVTASIGGLYLAKNMNEKALEAIDKVLTLRKQLPAQTISHLETNQLLPSHAQLLSSKGQALRGLSRWEEAIETFRMTASEAKLEKKQLLIGLILWGMADIKLDQLKQPDQAEQLCFEALPILQKEGTSAQVVWVLWTLGRSQNQLGKLQDASSTFNDMIKLAEKEHLSEPQVIGYASLADVRVALSGIEDALSTYQTALAIIRNDQWKGPPTIEPEMLLHMGKLYQEWGKYEEALEHFASSSSKYHLAQFTNGEAEALYRIARVYHWLNDVKAAISFYKKALGLYESLGESTKQLDVLASLTEAGCVTGEFLEDECAHYISQGHDLLASLTMASTVHPIDILLEIKRRFYTQHQESMITDTKQALTTFLAGMSAPFTPGEEFVAAYYYTFNLTKESNYTFGEWEKKQASLGADFLMAAGNFYQRRGAVLISGGQSDYLKQAQEDFTSARLFHSSAPIYRDLSLEIAKDCYLLGEVFRRQKNYKAAITQFNISNLLGAGLKTPEVHWVAAALGKTFEDMGERDLSLSWYKWGFEQLEKIQGQQIGEDAKLALSAVTTYPYQEYVVLLLDQHRKTKQTSYLHDAFIYTEKLKARAFLEQMSRVAQIRSGGMAGEVASKQEKIRRKIAEVHVRLRTPKLDRDEEARLLDSLTSLRESWNVTQREASKQDARYEQIFLPHIATLEEIQSTLDLDSTVLLYSDGPQRVILWAISKTKVHTYEIQTNIGAMIENYIKSLRQPLMSADEIYRHQALGMKLYELLIQPAAEDISGKRQLIIIPDSILFYLPFEALITPSGASSAKKNMPLSSTQYLIKKYEVSYLPSASTLLVQRSQHVQLETSHQFPLLAFGDPIYEDQPNAAHMSTESRRMLTSDDSRRIRLNRLQFSSQEVAFIASVWKVPTNSSHIYLRENASRQRLQDIDLSKYALVHFAAHALPVEGRWGKEPVLALTPDESGEGLLRINDILDLKFNAELVVLSACSTGLGRLLPGEGMLGLARSFMYAGARSVVASLWEVQDQSTSLLMGKFYHYLKEGHTKVKALRQAKLDVLNETINLKALGSHQSLASPFYWAPFILIGDGKRVSTSLQR